MPKLSPILAELAVVRDEVAQLERDFKTELRHELAKLHERIGFADVTTFLTAVKAAVRGKKARLKTGAAPAASLRGSVATRRRKRPASARAT
jgi:hypothetical protein